LVLYRFGICRCRSWFCANFVVGGWVVGANWSLSILSSFSFFCFLVPIWCQQVTPPPPLRKSATSASWNWSKCKLGATPPFSSSPPHPLHPHRARQSGGRERQRERVREGQREFGREGGREGETGRERERDIDSESVEAGSAAGTQRETERETGFLMRVSCF
jgi:hypothetical protein